MSEGYKLKLVLIILLLAIFSILVIWCSPYENEKLSNEKHTESDNVSFLPPNEPDLLVENQKETGAAVGDGRGAINRHEGLFLTSETDFKVSSNTTIRVAINRSNYQGLIHDSVTVSCDEAFTVSYEDGTETEVCAAQEKLSIASDDSRLRAGRLIIRASEGGRIKLLSVVRSSGNPEYRGIIELIKHDGGMVIVNELPLEEYLYAVVPSEMPTTYGGEALNVQAICARSYACNQIQTSAYAEYSAHLDDSVNSQVYNNVSENDASINAVKETEGEVMLYGGEIVSAYYFSTSCGSTASIWEVWPDASVSGCFAGSLQTTEHKKPAALSSEQAFRSFIDSTELQTYDSAFPWYRWSVSCSEENLEKMINTGLKARYEIDPDNILTLKNDEYVSIPVTDTGRIEHLEVSERGVSGIATEMKIYGKDNSYIIRYQTNIRTALKPLFDTVVRGDGTSVKGMKLLPSAFFYIDKTSEGYEITGGGYGHGVGMSQNGVKTMTELGYSYEEIIEHYYDDTHIEKLY